MDATTLQHEAARPADARAPGWVSRRARLAEYFDRTAVDAWAALTDDDAQVSRVRRAVRAGRATMRQTLLDWLPTSLHGRRVLDAGCGTGALAVAMAERGAKVVAVDVAPTLVALARQRAPARAARRITFLCGDLLDPALGDFDHVVAMDSLIHYDAPDAVAALSALAPRVRRSMAVTFVPRTPLLAVLHAVGQCFPRGDRSPAVAPVTEARLRRAVIAAPALASWRWARTERVRAAVYTSQAVELVPRAVLSLTVGVAADVALVRTAEDPSC